MPGILPPILKQASKKRIQGRMLSVGNGMRPLAYRKSSPPATFSAWSAPLSSPGKYRRCARWPRAALDLLAPAGRFTPGATARRADASLRACWGLGQSPKALCRSIFASVASVRRAQEMRLSPKSGVIQRSGPLPFPGSGRFFTGFPYREFCAEERFSLPRSGRPRSGR